MHGKRRVITAIDEFLDPSSAARMTPMVLTPGAMRAEIVAVSLGGVGVEIVDYSAAVATRGETVPERIGVLVPLRHMVSGHVNGETLAPDKLLVFGESSEVAGAVREPLRCGILSIEPQALQRAARGLGVEIDPPGRGDFRPVRSLLWMHLSGLFQRVLQTVRAGRDVPAMMGDAFAGAVAESLAVSECDSCRNGSRIDSVRVVRVCEQYATRCFYQNVSLADLCDATGASERRIRHAFYEVYGMSPTGYLPRRRSQ